MKLNMQLETTETEGYNPEGKMIEKFEASAKQAQQEIKKELMTQQESFKHRLEERKKRLEYKRSLNNSGTGLNLLDYSKNESSDYFTSGQSAQVKSIRPMSTKNANKPKNPFQDMSDLSMIKDSTNQDTTNQFDESSFSLDLLKRLQEIDVKNPSPVKNETINETFNDDTIDPVDQEREIKEIWELCQNQIEEYQKDKGD